MDPFDEFEFKPLTDGLGFHKKTVNLKEGLKNTGVLDDELQAIPRSVPKSLLEEPSAPAAKKPASKKHTFEDVLSALEKTPLNRPADLEFTETLPRETKKAMDIEMPRTPVQSPFPRPEAFKTPATNVSTPSPTMPLPGTRRGAADSPQRKVLDAATVSVPSAFLDFVIVLALSMVFLITLLTVTKVDLNAVLRNLNRDLMTQISLGVMFLAVMQMYVVIARSFFGRTLGEWTFDLQVGEDKEQESESYPLRVALRSVLITITGLVLLPLVSALLGRDIAGSISGAKLYRQRT
jgi:hypothetical protein